jgi:hypothetical protein
MFATSIFPLSKLKKALQHNLFEEDVHTAWFSMRLTDYDNLILAELLKF